MVTISEQDTLPAGARVGEFEIQQVLGIGGFGMVYLAFDHALERQVAIKEFMPASLARRGDGAQVVVRSAAHADTFALGLRSFVNEARLLARFDHPSLVKVYRFWEANGTAYMVMPYYKGITLQQVRRDMSTPPDEAWLRRLINPLLGALDCLHRENVFHRDVAPDNILLLDDDSGPGAGLPVLLDLGAARHVIGDHTQTLTAIVKPSFAPIEQYAETVQLRQGPWTDLYALAAVVHFCVTGRPPMPATVRVMDDAQPTLRQLSVNLASSFDLYFSEPFIHAIDHALCVRPLDRPDSVSAWRAELSGVVSTPSDGTQGPLRVSHESAQDLSYMTTVPAAGRLKVNPEWPAWSANPPNGLTESTAVGAQIEHIPATMPVTHAAEKRGPPTGNRERQPGLRWIFVALLAVTALALWWSQRSIPKPPQSIPPSGAISTEKSVTKPKLAHKPLAPESAKKDDTASSNTGAGAVKNDSLASPRKACGDRNFISMAICIKRHCVRPEYAAHPECERMRQQEAAQTSNYP
ncbi:MAG: serine/threonine-protein kinase [Aquabacterium sp.]|nr:serine/threonine-protein kinase [Aquabacterium sp.]